MFLAIASFEFRYQLRQPIFWVGAIIFGLFGFAVGGWDLLRFPGAENVYRNAPYIIALWSLVLGVFYMFVVAAFVANVVIRDDQTGFGPILRTTPVPKFDYLYGRFTGAFAAAALAFVSVPVGMALGAAGPWLDPETVGPFVLRDYVFTYFVLNVPVIFLLSAAFFTLATVTRSMMWTYVCAVGLLAFNAVANIFLSRPGMESLAAYWDPFGTGAYRAATEYWTASERNTLVPELSGRLLFNHLGWTGVSLALLALSFVLFRFKSAELSGQSGRAAVAGTAELPPAELLAPAPDPAQPAFGARTTLAQLWARTRLDMAQVFKSAAYFVLVGIAVVLFGAFIFVTTSVTDYGGRIFPVTRVVITGLVGSFSAVFGSIIAIYYAGELVWRERERRVHELVDAAPVPDWMFIVPKTLAISLVLITTLMAGIVVGVIAQAILGYFNYRLDEYVVWYLVPNTVDMILTAVLAVFIQAMSPNKFVGWAAMAVFRVLTLVMAGVGLDHHLYQYDGGPPTPLSDMNGQGRFWVGAWWFRLYWSAFAVVLMVLAYGLWRRGTETRFAPRLRALPGRLKGASGAILAVAVLVFAGSGGFIFYNTNVLNTYRSPDDEQQRAADYEKRFLRYAGLPQPKIAEVKLDIEIYPHEPRVETHGAYVIQNRTGAAVSVLHLRFAPGLIVDAASVEGAHLQSDFADFNYRIYAFDRPMQPGEVRTVTFATTLRERGFRNSGDLLRVLDNGTFLNADEVAPRIGMDRTGLLQDRALRRKYGLPPELTMPALGTPGADQVNYLRHDADWVTSDITVSTDADQTPIAPGQAVSQSVQGGRRTVRFVSDSPIMAFFSAQSARYSVATETYKGIALSVYYDPQHPWNVARIQAALRAGLDYYQANFGPYQFHQVRVLEFPAPDGDFAQSYANTIAWSEGIFFIADLRDPSGIDMVTYVGAHELAHQWWAHQVIGADEQGSTALSETLAQYSSEMVMKRLYGPYQMRKFLKFELDGYLRGRAGSVLAEQPLERVENQPFVHYNKGALVMYRLQDEIGEDAVNRALRHLLHDFAFKGPPYPTSLDLVNDLRTEAPADKQQLISDLFEKIALYDIKASHALARKRPDGRYDLTFTVTARKLYADGAGHETEAPLAESMDVGAFDVAPGQPGYGAAKVIALQKLPIHSGVQSVTLTVSRLPKVAAVDPFSELIDRNADAAVTQVAAR